MSVASSDVSVATVTPSSVTFSSCGYTAALTIAPVGQGTATSTASQTSNTLAGTFNLAPAAFTVKVTAPAPTNTAPA